MPFEELGTGLDRNFRNGLNAMLQELFNHVSTFETASNGLATRIGTLEITVQDLKNRLQVLEQNGGGTTNPADTTAPSVSALPAGGTFNSSQQVTLSANETVDIYYTIDGSTPTITSTKYIGPITISNTMTLKFFAKDTAGNSSTAQTQVYTITSNTNALVGSAIVGTSQVN